MCIDFKRNGNFQRISPFKIDCKEGRLGDSKGNSSDFPMIDCHPLKWVDYGGPQVPTATRSCKVDEISPKSPKKWHRWQVVGVSPQSTFIVRTRTQTYVIKPLSLDESNNQPHHKPKLVVLRRHSTLLSIPDHTRQNPSKT